MNTQWISPPTKLLWTTRVILWWSRLRDRCWRLGVIETHRMSKWDKYETPRW